MIRWMCAVSMSERRSSAELRAKIGVEAIGNEVKSFEAVWA